MNAAPTPNATHMPCRCSSMCSACDSPSTSGWCQKNSVADAASDSATSAQVQRDPRITVASAIGTR